jgi:hypothetical protein
MRSPWVVSRGDPSGLMATYRNASGATIYVLDQSTADAES